MPGSDGAGENLPSQTHDRTGDGGDGFRASGDGGDHGFDVTAQNPNTTDCGVLSFDDPEGVLDDDSVEDKVTQALYMHEAEQRAHQTTKVYLEEKEMELEECRKSLALLQQHVGIDPSLKPEDYPMALAEAQAEYKEVSYDTELAEHAGAAALSNEETQWRDKMATDTADHPDWMRIMTNPSPSRHFELGTHYFRGDKGTPKDYARAAECFQVVPLSLCPLLINP